MRQVLMLAYHFPPNGGSGVQRSSKFAKYLPKYGWQPVVVSAKPVTAISRDDTLLQDLPAGLEVHRIPPAEPLVLRKFARKTLRPELQTNSSSTSTTGAAKAALYSFMRKAKSGISLALIPDEQVLWALSAASLGLFLAKKHSFDVVYSSGSPFSSHLGAVLVGKALHKPVVIDFRDPWTKHRHYGYSGRREQVDHIFEKHLLRSADYVVCNHETMARDFRAMVPEVDPNKFVVITNGYDEDDFGEHLQLTERCPGEYRIAHVGLVYPGIGLPFLEGLRLFRERHADLTERIRVRFVGGLPLPEEELSYLRKEKLHEVVEIMPRVPHRESLREMLSADALLLLLIKGPLGEAAYPGKIYEYLRAGKPILAVAPPEGVAAELVRLCGEGIVTDPDDPPAIAQALENLVQRNVKAQSEPNLRFAYHFNREELTRRLTRVFEAACGEAILSAEDLSNVIKAEEE